jgi:hypothetical protein
MKKTAWFPPHIKPVRDGWYERDYRETHHGDIYQCLWLQFRPGVGCWYVEEAGRTIEAYHENLPWRGLTEEAK